MSDARSIDRWRKLRLVALFAPLVALFAWHAWTAAWQCDDAYISFRYVWNFLHGHGLVWNVGERVEGYTNFLWVLELSFVWKVFGVAPEIACDVLSVLCTALALWMVVKLAFTGPNEGRRTFVAFGALVLLATSRTWAVWTTSGLETRQFTLLVLLGAVLVLRGSGNPRRLAIASFVFAMLEYTRPEGGLMWTATLAWLVIEALVRRSFRPRDFLAFVVPFVLLVGAHYVWRRVYYDDWLPNTYYAKHVRAWNEMGLAYYAEAALETGAWLLLPFAVIGAVSRAQRGDRTHVLFALLIVPHAVYLSRIGGDHFELRPLDYYWPLVAIAAVEGMLATSAVVAAKLADAGWIVSRATAPVLAGVLLATGVVYGSALQIAKVLYTMDFETREESLKLIVKLDRKTSPWLYALPGMESIVETYDSLLAYTLSHGVGVVWREHEVFCREELASWKPYSAIRGRGLLPPDTTISRGSIGIIGYYLADVAVIDQKGLTDKHIAHQESKRKNSQRYMAHDRFGDPEYLFERGTTVMIDPAEKSGRAALLTHPYAVQFGPDLWMPMFSLKAGWVEQAFAGKQLWSRSVERTLGCFEDGDDGWALGDAFYRDNPRTGLPARRSALWQPRCEGAKGLDSRDEYGRGIGHGSATSPHFVIPKDVLLEASVGGTPDEPVGIRVFVGKKLIKVIKPVDVQMMLPEHVDLSEYEGGDLWIQAFDDTETGWVAVDDFVLLAAKKR